MSKLNQVLHNYVDKTGILLEQPPVDPAAAPPAPPAGDPMAGPPADPAIPAPPDAPAPDAGGEGETKTLTDQGYVEAVRDMLELLSINPEDIEDNDMDIFEDKVNPQNAYDIHEKIRDLIDRYGSPTGR